MEPTWAARSSRGVFGENREIGERKERGEAGSDAVLNGRNNARDLGENREGKRGIRELRASANGGGGFGCVEKKAGRKKTRAAVGFDRVVGRERVAWARGCRWMLIQRWERERAVGRAGRVEVGRLGRAARKRERGRNVGRLESAH